QWADRQLVPTTRLQAARRQLPLPPPEVSSQAGVRRTRGRAAERREVSQLRSAEEILAHLEAHSSASLEASHAVAYFTQLGQLSRTLGQKQVQGQAFRRLIDVLLDLVLADEIDFPGLCGCMEASARLRGMYDKIQLLFRRCAAALGSEGHLRKEGGVVGFSGSDLAAAGWALARCQMCDLSASRALASAASATLSELTSRELGRLVWAFGSLQAASGQAGAQFVSSAVLEFSTSTASASHHGLGVGLGARDFSALCWAAARTMARPGAVPLRALSARAAAVAAAGKAGPQDLSNMAWAFAKLAMGPEALLDLGAAAVARVSELEAQHISNVAWALAKACAKGEESMRCLVILGAAAAAQVSALDAQHISNVAWALAKASAKAEQTLRCFSRQALHRFGEFSPQGVSNLVWALAKAEVCEAQLLNKALTMVLERAEAQLRLKPQELVNLIWSAASLADAGSTDVLESVLVMALSDIRHFGAQDLSNFAWSLAKISTKDAARLLRATEPDVRAKLQELAPQHIANLAWAYAMLAMSELDVLPMLAELAVPRVREFAPPGLVALAWAFSSLAAAGSMGSAQLGISDNKNNKNNKNNNNKQHIVVVFGVPYWQLVSLVAEGSLERLGELATAQLSSLAWAIASFPMHEHDLDGRQRCCAVVRRLARAAAESTLQRGERISARSLCNLAWTMAKSAAAEDNNNNKNNNNNNNDEDRELLKWLAVRALALQDELNAQDVANLAWALAKSAVLGDAQLLRALAAAASLQLRAAEGTTAPQQLCSLAWSCAKLGALSGAGTAGSELEELLLGDLAAESIRRVAEFSPQELAGVAWAFASCGALAPGGGGGVPQAVLHAIVPVASAHGRLESFDAQALSALAWSMATSSLREEQALLVAVATAAASQAKELQPLELSNLLWALATLCVQAPKAVHELLQTVSQELARYGPRDISRLLWALSQMACAELEWLEEPCRQRLAEIGRAADCDCGSGGASALPALRCLPSAMLASLDTDEPYVVVELL
ncbi:unnamed protein product, partial [Polarella glacialis]